MKRLKDDEDVVKKSLYDSGLFVEFASERLKNNLDIALMAVQKDGLALAFLSPSMQSNFQVVSTALSQDGRALAFASEELRNNEEIVLKALKNCPHSFKYAGKKIKEEKKFVLMTLESEGKLDFVGIDPKWFKDPIFMFEGVKISSKLLSKFDKEFLTYDMALAFVKRDGVLLEYLEDYQEDFQLVKEAVSQNGMALKFASKKLQNNLEIALIAMARDKESVRYIGDEVREYLRSIPDKYPK